MCIQIVGMQLCNVTYVTIFEIFMFKFPYGKAVFVRISGEYAANILQTALFTVIFRYIFTSGREYPANKVGLTKK